MLTIPQNISALLGGLIPGVCSGGKLVNSRICPGLPLGSVKLEPGLMGRSAPVMSLKSPIVDGSDVEAAVWIAAELNE